MDTGDEHIEREELDVANMPHALNYLINEVVELRSMIEEMRQQLQLGYDRRRPITVGKAADVLSVSERAVRKLAKDGLIPYYMVGTTMYFFEEELIEYVKKTRVKPYWETTYKTRNRL